jgi:hypothetical protein
LFRTLNKYQGIAFVEARGDRTLVKALASKVDLSVAFNPLDLDRTLSLFQMNINYYNGIAKQRAVNMERPLLVIGEDSIIFFAKQNFREFHGSWWNGHQISKAFQMAISLAYIEQKDAIKVQLEGEHLKNVARFIP